MEALLEKWCVELVPPFHANIYITISSLSYEYKNDPGTSKTTAQYSKICVEGPKHFISLFSSLLMTLYLNLIVSLKLFYDLEQ